MSGIRTLNDREGRHSLTTTTAAIEKFFIQAILAVYFRDDFWLSLLTWIPPVGKMALFSLLQDTDGGGAP